MTADATIVSVGFALSAAVLWLLSARVYLPVLGSGWGTLVSRMADGSRVDSADPFYTAMRKVSRLNFAAAACACVSTVAQALALYTSKAG